MKNAPAEKLEALAATWFAHQSEENLLRLWEASYLFLKEWASDEDDVMGEGNRRRGSIRDIPGIVTLEFFGESRRIRTWDPEKRSFGDHLLWRARKRIRDIRNPHKKIYAIGAVREDEVPDRKEIGIAPRDEQPDHALLEQEREVEKRQLADRVRRSYRRISTAEDRDVFRRVYVQLQTYDNVALQLGRSPGTLKNRQFRLFDRVAGRMGLKRVRRGA